MLLDGFHIKIGLPLRFGRIRLPPNYSNASLVLGIRACCHNSVTLIVPRMDRMSLFIRIEILCCEVCRGQIKGPHVNGSSSVNDIIQSTSSGCLGIPKSNGLIKGFCEFVLGSLAPELLLQTSHALGRGVREGSMTGRGWEAALIWWFRRRNGRHLHVDIEFWLLMKSWWLRRPSTGGRPDKSSRRSTGKGLGLDEKRSQYTYESKKIKAQWC